jgi:hypothetical protein
MLAATVGGCTSTARKPDREQLVAQVTAAELAFAKTMADRDHAAFLSFVAEDAVFLGGGDPLRGRAAVGEAWKRFYTDPDPPFAWNPELVECGSHLRSRRSAAPDGRIVAPSFRVARSRYSLARGADNATTTASCRTILR